PQRKTGIDRMAEENDDILEAAVSPAVARQSETKPEPAAPEVAERADSDQKPKTTLPKIERGFKLPPSSLLQRPDEQQAVDADELKLLAQVLTAKYAEFGVHGQVTQIN